MIQIPLKTFRSEGFYRAANKLAHSQTLHNPTALLSYSILYEQMMEKWKAYDVEWQALVAQYRANQQTGQDPNMVELDPERREEFKEKSDAFDSETVEFDREPIEHYAVAEAGLTAAELILLKPLFTPFEAPTKAK